MTNVPENVRDALVKATLQLEGIAPELDRVCKDTIAAQDAYLASPSYKEYLAATGADVADETENGTRFTALRDAAIRVANIADTLTS